MSLNQLIINTLKPLGVPVGFHKYQGSAATYITFFEFNQNGALFADDEEQLTSHSIQVDIWSKGDYTELVKQVKNELMNVGFSRPTENELYENDTELFHKVLRFNFVQ
jgi:hypothetical protein